VRGQPEGKVKDNAEFGEFRGLERAFEQRPAGIEANVVADKHCQQQHQDHTERDEHERPVKVIIEETQADRQRDSEQDPHDLAGKDVGRFFAHAQRSIQAGGIYHQQTDNQQAGDDQQQRNVERQFGCAVSARSRFHKFVGHSAFTHCLKHSPRSSKSLKAS